MTTPSQTVGPFFSIGLTDPWPDGPDVVAVGTPGRLTVAGRVLDGDGEPVGDALIETWQADPDGRFDTDFRGFGRAGTDPAGRWAIHTLKPGRFEAQAPHLAVSVLARGLLARVITRIYFADEAAANAEDPVLASLPDDARTTLIAAVTDDGYALDIHLQGEHETAFFAL